MTGNPIQLDGNTAPSFEALESVVETAPAAKAEAPETEKQSSTSKNEETITFKDLDNSEESTKTPKKAQEPKELEKTETAPEKISEVSATEEKKEEETTTSKSLKLKVGPRGKELELPTDVKIPVTIDGEEKEFTLQELRNIKSGEVSYDKRFTELDKKEKAFKADKDATEQQLTTVLSKVIEEQDAGGALLELARIAGVDPAPLYSAMQAEIVGELDKFFGMSDVERKAYLLEKENSFLKKNEKSLSDRKNAEQAKLELEREIGTLKETLNVSDEWVSMAEADIKANPQLHKDWLGGKSPTPQQVIQLADAMKRHDTTVKVLTEVDPELLKDPNVVEFGMNKLKGVKDVSFEELVQAAREFFKRPDPQAQKVTENITKKIEQAKKVSDSDDEAVTAKPKKEAKIDRSEFDWDAL